MISHMVLVSFIMIIITGKLVKERTTATNVKHIILPLKKGQLLKCSLRQKCHEDIFTISRRPNFALR